MFADQCKNKFSLKTHAVQLAQTAAKTAGQDKEDNRQGAVTAWRYLDAIFSSTAEIASYRATNLL